jgi:hypothetical protein
VDTDPDDRGIAGAGDVFVLGGVQQIVRNVRHGDSGRVVAGGG